MLKRSDAFLNPGRAARDQVAFGPPRNLFLEHAAADQRPQRLIVMITRRLNNRHIGLPQRLEEPGGYRNAGSAAPNDNDAVMLRSCCVHTISVARKKRPAIVEQINNSGFP